MVIKSLSRKSKSYAQLLSYIVKDKVDELSCVRHNLPSQARNFTEILGAFLDNGRLIKPRKNGVEFYHEVLSFHQLDQSVTTPQVLRQMTEFYLQLRAPNSLAFAQPHFDASHPHVHIILAANQQNTTKKHRLSKGQFLQVKQAVERFQQERFPEIQHSRVEHKQKTYPPLFEREILEAATLAMSRQEFDQRIERLTFFRHKAVVRRIKRSVAYLGDRLANRFQHWQETKKLQIGRAHV